MKSVHGSGARAIGGRGGGGMLESDDAMSANFTFWVGSAMMLDGFLRN